MSPTNAQRMGERIRHEVRTWTFTTRRGREGRQGGPLPETRFSPMHRERAEVKRARRRVRNIRVTWRQGYVYHEQELKP